MDKIQGLVITYPNISYIKNKASYYTNLKKKKTLMFAVCFLVALPLTSVLQSKMCQTLVKHEVLMPRLIPQKKGKSIFMLDASRRTSGFLHIEENPVRRTDFFQSGF